MPLVEVERQTPWVAMVTLNDPETRNAMTAAMGESLREQMRRLQMDGDLRAVVVTGTPPAFSAGGDLAMLRSHALRAREDGHDVQQEMLEFYELFLAVRDLPVPVLAAVNGHAIGAGLCVALACDLLLVAREAKVGLNFVRLGLHPGMGSTWFLPRSISRQDAAELLYTGRLISGVDAASRGIALRALPSAAVLPATLELASEIAAASPLAVRQLKQSLRSSHRQTLAEQLAVEAHAQSENYATNDLAEGLAALTAHRSPVFHGD